MGISWQIYLINEKAPLHIDSTPPRVYPAAFFGTVIFLGVLVTTGFSAYVENNSLSYKDALSMDFKAFVFAAFLTLKAYLGPIVLAWTISFITYHYFDYGVFKTIPFV